MSTRRLSAVLLALTMACGGGGPTEARPPTPTLAIVSGDSQTVAVTDTLPFDAEVQVTRGGDPVPDQLVDWRVLEDDAGEPFVTTTQTNASGFTGNRVVAGTRAHTHPDMDGSAHMEVRWIRQVSDDSIETIVDTTITYRVLPGRLAAITTGGDPIRVRNESYIRHGDTIDLKPYITGGTDQWGNPIPIDRVRDAPAEDVEWAWEDRVSNSSAAGPTGTGWTTGVDTVELLDRGYTVIETPVTCTNPDEGGTVRTLAPGITPVVEGVVGERLSAEVFLSGPC